MLKKYLGFLIVFSLVFVKGVDVMANENINKKAIFAGGCFWCMQPPFDKLEGVLSTSVGYTGGLEKDPTYQEVASGQTSHCEAIEVVFDPAKVSYEKLLEVFWMNIDPTTKDCQFSDCGEHYRTEIFYLDEEQKRLAQESKEKLNQSSRYKSAIVTEITKASNFYDAEEYHQKYYQKSAIRYKFYKAASGRDQYLKSIWKQ